MKKFLIVSSLILLFAGCQDFNSNTFDKNRFSGFDLTTRQGRAMKVINDKCVSCHTNFHGTWSADEFRETRTKWESAGLIDPLPNSDFTTSELIKRLINYGDDMPLGGSQLSTGEIYALCEWIEDNPAGCP